MKTLPVATARATAYDWESKSTQTGPNVRMSTPCDRARWIVCDRTSRWARSIRVAIRFDPGLGAAIGHFLETRLLEVPSHDACFTELQNSPASFITLGVDEDSFATCLDLTATVGRRFPRAQVAIGSSCEDRPTEWHSRSLAFREAGAVMATRNIWELPSLAKRAHRHLVSVPATEHSITDRIWDSLPWDPS